jgi:hypothetical protein
MSDERPGSIPARLTGPKDDQETLEQWRARQPASVEAAHKVGAEIDQRMGWPSGIVHVPEARVPMTRVEAAVLLGIVAILSALTGFIVWVVAG